MKVRCIETDHINYSFSIGCDYDVDVFTDNSGNTFDVVHGDYIWFYFDKQQLTANKRNGDPVAKFEIIE